ncbi:MAG: hypothetical protein H6711_13180 [Myxococcales bacterium]|nr:hypothetical protein [Myxococcales bacterium]
MEGRRAITPRAAAAWILEAPAAAWALALVALAFGLWSGLGDRYLHDEGLLTWHFAQVTLEAPAAALFWQKSRPLLAALYGPFAGLGQPVFTVIHVVIAALALPLLAGVARAIGQRSPNLPALLVASSALWLACGPAGVSNSDALTGLCLALYLWLARGRPLAAGLLLGALLFARSEVAVFAGGIGLYALLRGPRRLALAIPALPAIYALLGALYHHDLLWSLRFPPALPAPPPETPRFGAAGYAAGLGDTLDALVALSPALLLLLAARPRRMAVIERLAAALALAYLAAIRGLPAIGLFNFDSSPRYLLPALPFAALAIGPVIDGWREGGARERATTLALAIALALGLAADRLGGSPLPLAAAAGLAAVVALARAGRPRGGRDRPVPRDSIFPAGDRAGDPDVLRPPLPWPRGQRRLARRTPRSRRAPADHRRPGPRRDPRPPRRGRRAPALLPPRARSGSRAPGPHQPRGRPGRGDPRRPRSRLLRAADPAADDPGRRAAAPSPLPRRRRRAPGPEPAAGRLGGAPAGARAPRSDADPDRRGRPVARPARDRR